MSDKFYKQMEKTMNKHKKSLKKSKDEIFIVDSSKIDNKSMIFLEQSIDRHVIVNKLNNELHNLKMAIKIEAGMFEYSLLYAREKNIIDTLLPNVYMDKFNSIIDNISKSSTVKNKTLKKRLINGGVNPRTLAFLSPHEINPDVWKIQIRKAELRKYKSENMAATDLYKCRNCGERKCQITQKQTRSADEPMTTYVTCLVCYNVFKF